MCTLDEGCSDSDATEITYIVQTFHVQLLHVYKNLLTHRIGIDLLCVGETRDYRVRVDNDSIDLYAERDICVAAGKRANIRDLEGVKIKDSQRILYVRLTRTSTVDNDVVLDICIC